MKSFKYMSLMATLTAILTLSFSSCSSDDDPMPAKPVITLTEVGHDNTCHAHPGHDLHLEAQIVAEGLIKDILVEIHSEDGKSAVISHVYSDSKYVGVRNTEFHEHIDIPATFPLGAYHLHLTVTDQEGQQTTAESKLTLVEDDGDEEMHEHEH